MIEKCCRLRPFNFVFSCGVVVYFQESQGKFKSYNEKMRFGFSVFKSIKVFRITSFCKQDIGYCIRSRWYTTNAAEPEESASKTAKKERVKFKRLDGSMDTSTSSYQQRSEYSKTLEENHNKFISLARSGGGEKAMQRHTQVNKKLFVRDRLRLLLDEYCDNTFLEIGTLAGFGMPYGDIPCASTVIGTTVGLFHNKPINLI